MNSEPTLAAPGAGLPALELFIARRLFALKRRFGNRAGFTAQFSKERSAIRALIDAIPVADRDKRVLIPRLRGLEDSSRYWSVWMTLDHLRITNLVFTGVILGLCAGRIPPGKADTASVKPDPSVTGEVEAEYEKSCDKLLSAVSRVAELKTKLRYEHPWFGPLDAAGWHALAATHLRIHRAQIEKIRNRLPVS